ncbi:hypothetical protein BCR44DRAFT_119655 [Catenaria anguillulae PL171]|uniref:Inositol-1-monophosphatase n=1 Tax=Catenaria anguillulae PL171 TaxID=765915 RepID=A0A1Y2HA80_9FUNG|nr:hypothetical protein BCR44DRAFT_119655 [Catenaria anguillulae PL171]
MSSNASTAATTTVRDDVIGADAPFGAWCTEATKLAREVGAIIRTAFFDAQAPPAPDNKDNNAIDLVTATDQAVEALIKKRLDAVFPDYKFIGEESVAGGAKCELTDAPTVICDPIDGTTNFVHGFPFVCTSLGLVVNRQPTAAVIYNPILDEMYIAHRGHGAFMNGRCLPIHRANHPLDQNAVLMVTEGGHDRGAVAMKAKLDTWHNVLSASKANLRGIRCTGSGALNLCMIARGGADVYWEIGLHAWDMAAAVLLVEEAGGMVVGQEYLGATEAARKTWSRDSHPFDVMGRKAMALRKADVGFLHQFVGHVVDYPCERD